MISIYTTKTAGRLTISITDAVTIHLLPRDKEDQFWGLQNDWYDGPLHHIGFGRLALVCLFHCWWLDKLLTPLTEADLSKCPGCGGPADQGHDREYPPSPYYCSKCDPVL